MGNILKIITEVLGPLEQLAAIFIHNPKSQQVEGVIVTGLNTALQVGQAVTNTVSTVETNVQKNS